MRLRCDYLLNTTIKSNQTTSRHAIRFNPPTWTTSILATAAAAAVPPGASIQIAETTCITWKVTLGVQNVRNTEEVPRNVTAGRTDVAEREARVATLPTPDGEQSGYRTRRLP